MNNKDLENRLIHFAVMVIKLENKIMKTKSGNLLYGQLIRSSSSCPLNYGEAQSAESRKDFIHKLKIISKELRETYINLRIIKLANLSKDLESLHEAIDETNILISIFVSSIKTAEKNIMETNKTKIGK
jgi:four helix bundle protein